MTRKSDIEALDRVEIVFHDAWYDDSQHWTDMDAVENGAEPCHSVGYFIEADEIYLTIAQTIGTHQLGHLFHIPVPAIVSMERI